MEIENIITETAAPEQAPQEQQTQAETPVNIQTEETSVQETVQPETDAAALPESAKSLDIKAFETEYAENGALSPESYKSLEDAGIPKHIVDNYIESQHAVQAVKILDIKSSVGGEDQYSKLINWAEKNLSAQEKVTYNSIVSSGDTSAIKLALSGIHARRKISEGYSPERTIDSVEANTSCAGYESVAQMVHDVKDPRYRNDPAFRAKVERKAAHTKLG